MILELNGTKVTIVDKTLGYQGDNLVNTIQVTVDKDSTWNYKLDMYKGKSKCFDSMLMTREGNVCTVQLTNEILSYGGRYIFQLRGYTDTQTYHSDIFESWVNTSVEYQGDCRQACECDCKLPTEFYQIEDNITEINNYPPYLGDNNKWMIWDVNKHEYVESNIDVIGGGGGNYQTKANLTTSITAESTDEQYPSAKATYEYGQSIAESAGKINAITVNGTAQTVEDKTAKIVVDKSTVGLSNVDNTSDKDKPVSTLQAAAIADAKKAGTDAQANLTVHINDKDNPHEVTKAQVGLGNVNNTSDANKPISTATQTALNGKLDKTAVVDVTVEALKGQAADAKSVYDAIEAAKPDIVTPTAESTDAQAASAKAVWDMLGTGGSGGSGTDISLGVTGASVGDIIKVKAVDSTGKPTAWEAAELGMRLIRAITLAEQTDRVDITTDENGNTFLLNEVYCSVNAQSYTDTNERYYFLPNGGWTTGDPYITSSNASSKSSDSWKNQMNFHCVYASGYIMAEQLPAGGSNNNLQSRAVGNMSPITKISVAGKMAVGCTIVVWGR